MEAYNSTGVTGLKSKNIFFVFGLFDVICVTVPRIHFTSGPLHSFALRVEQQLGSTCPTFQVFFTEKPNPPMILTKGNLSNCDM